MERLLRRPQADIQEKTRKGFSPLHCALLRGRDLIVQVLLDRGADCNARTCDGDSCLAVAAANGNVAAVHQLLVHGASVNLEGGAGLMPLHHAAMRQDEFSEEIVQMLLDNGASLSATSSSGETAEDLASALGQNRVAALLAAEATRRAECEAFAMGQHGRLGATSPVLGLEEGVVRMVLDQL